MPPPTNSGSPSTTVIVLVAAILEISSRPQKTATMTAYVPLGVVANDGAEGARRGWVAYSVVTRSDPSWIAPLAARDPSWIAPLAALAVSHGSLRSLRC